MARVNASRVINGMWKVNKVCDEHNHETLNPNITRYYQQHIVVPPNVKLGLEIGDFQPRSIKALNHEYLERGDDSKNMLVQMQQHNPDFFYAIDSDDKGQMRNIIWIDGRSRAACKEFYDVINFDITYFANKYDLPLALFVGVNHHCRFILLDCAII